MDQQEPQWFEPRFVGWRAYCDFDVVTGLPYCANAGEVIISAVIKRPVKFM
jgi:hypothetical protein